MRSNAHGFYLACYRDFVLVASCLTAFSSSAYSQVTTCVTAPPKASTPADQAYAQGKWADAEVLYKQTITQQPQDSAAIAGLARTQLHMAGVAAAQDTLQLALTQNPNSAPLLAELGEVQLRQGQPWLARKTLHTAEALDPCFPRTLLLLGQIDRLDSMYASQRAEITRAYAIDPQDSEITRAWNTAVAPADQIASTQEYLATTKDIEPGLRKSAEATVHDTLALLSETSQPVTYYQR